MRILVVGSGGREHALCWAIAASPLVDKLYCAPGNAGIAEDAECVPIAATDTAGLIAVLPSGDRSISSSSGRRRRWSPGSSMRWKRAGIAAFGPSAAAAALEGSKGFMKDLCAREGIPTAAYRRFTDAAAAKAYIAAQGAPIVVKADGLAAGKGVVVAATVAEADAAVDAALGGRFGAAGAEIVVEEFLAGEEASFFALCDGDARAAARRGAGPQARRRRRHRPQYRRHGRLFAGADRDPGARGRGHGAHHPADGAGDGARRHARSRACSTPG